MLSSQGFEQRGLHDPVQPVQMAHIHGQEIILDDTPVLGLILRDDRMITITEHL